MQNSVSSIVWPWRNPPGGTGATGKGAKPSRKAAVLQAAVMTAVGSLLFWWLGHRAMGIIVWGLAAFVLVSGLFVPPVFAAIERSGRWLGKWVGDALTWGLLVPFYYICFIPLRLAFKLKGVDPLCRRIHTDDRTYWTARRPARDPLQYRKQF